MRKKYLGLLMFCGLLLSAMPAVAHHSIASEYDFNKEIEIKGMLTRVGFINPHGIFEVEVTNPDNTKTTWVFQAGGASNIRRSLGGARPGDLTGKTITIYGFAAKNGKPGGFVKALKMEDGKTITMWFGDPNG